MMYKLLEYQESIMRFFDIMLVAQINKLLIFDCVPLQLYC